MLSKRTVISVLVLVAVYFFGGQRNKPIGRIVQTNSGAIQGTTGVSREGREFDDFLGVPYAKPPVGKLRFAKPEPLEKWDGIRDARTLPPICAQLDVLVFTSHGSEDCLYLNIHVPKGVEEGKLLPVIVFIHGGYFASLSSIHFRPEYLMDFDVILITMNYRLGAFGFLSADDEHLRGNFGLQDQHMALKWINQNIEKFGGDRNSVVISGNSAGAASCNYQMLNQKNKGLFKGVISQSGAVLNPWTFSVNPKEQAQRFAQSVNCPTRDSKEMVECLRKLDTSVLIEAQAIVREKGGVHGKGDLFLPIIESTVDEHTFISEDPRKLLTTGKFLRVPWMVGIVEDEGLLISPFYFEEKFRESAETDWNNGFAETELILTSKEKVHSQKIREFYFGKDTKINTMDVFDQITKLYGDRWFTTGIVEAARLTAQFSPVYLYEYKKSPPSMYPVVVHNPRTRYSTLNFIVTAINYVFRTYVPGFYKEYPGTTHADDLITVFKIPVITIGVDSPHFNFSKDYTKLWVDFAYGSPTLKFGDHVFPELDPKGPTKFFEIKDKPEFTENADINKRLEFWSSLT